MGWMYFQQVSFKNQMFDIGSYVCLFDFGGACDVGFDQDRLVVTPLTLMSLIIYRCGKHKLGDGPKLMDGVLTPQWILFYFIGGANEVGVESKVSTNHMLLRHTTKFTILHSTFEMVDCEMPYAT